MFFSLILVGCSGESDGEGAQPATDAGVEASLDDGESDVITEDSPGEAFSVPLCTELGVEAVLPYTITITNDFAKKVVADCHVIKLLFSLGPQEASAWTEKTKTWTGAFFACPGSGERVESFGPVETGKSPALSQTDIDVLVEHFAAATEQSLTLSTAQSQALREELAAVAALSVNVPIAGHALSLCTDAGVSDAGSDADAAPDLDAGTDADVDAADAEAGP